MWTIRCLYELDSWQDASFITLTYDNEHLPSDFSLHPEHLQQFWKSLRQRLDRPIKYYACGEYGDKKALPYKHGRPHYHAIVYGLDSYNKEDRQAVQDVWHRSDTWMISEMPDGTTDKGKGMLPVCREDIAYTCGYVQKKLNGDLATDIYGDKVRPFSRCSRGIGLEFAQKNSERLKKNGFTYLNGQKIAVPRYFRDKLEIEQREMIKTTNLDPEVCEQNANYLWTLFERDQKAKGIWYPDNATMTMTRFERWLNDFEFSLARRVEKDYQRRKNLTSRYL